MIRQKSFNNEQATLYLVATPIGNLSEMTFRAIDTLKEVDCIAAEDTRNTIKLMNHFDIHTKLISHHEHNIESSSHHILSLLAEGKNIALVSDAGYPAISDPGYELVQAAINDGYNVVPISGANACLNALVVSGIAPQPFTFFGFLNHSEKNKKKQLESLKDHQFTLVFYESPHRINKTLNSIYNVFGNRQIAICREITKKHEEIIRGELEVLKEEVNDLKGEIVLVIEGADKVEEIIEIDSTEKVKEYISKGMTPKDAIKEVAKLYNLPKNKVYDEYNKSK